MNRVIRADVPMPFWDEWAGYFILPVGLSDIEASKAILALVRERRPDAAPQEAP